MTQATFFDAEWRTDPITKDFKNWENLCAFVQHEEAPTKESVKLISGAIYKPGGTRGYAGIDSHWLLIWDCDYSTIEKMRDTQARAVGFSAIFYSTFNSSKENFKWRLMMPLAEKCSREQFRPTRRAMEKILGIESEKDTSADTEPHMYYLPAHPPGADFVLEKSLGRAVELMPPEPLPILGNAVSSQNHKDFAGYKKYPHSIMKRWAKKVFHNKEENKRLIELYKLIEQGLPFAEPGKRNKASFDLANFLAWALFNTAEELRCMDEQSLIDFMSRSIAATTRDEDPSHAIEEFRDQFRRARRDCNTKKFGAPASVEEAVEWEKWAADKRPSNVELWSDEKIEEIEERLFKDMPFCPILQSGNLFFFVTEKGITSGFTMNEAISAARRFGLEKFGVEFTVVKNGRACQATIQDLMFSHGQVVDEIEGHFTGHSLVRCEVYDDRPNKIVLQLVNNPVKTVPPIFSQKVCDYISNIVKNKAELPQLLSWLARFPQWDKSSNVLLLHGLKNSGKSTFADALAGFFPNVARGTSFEQAFGAFNHLLTKSFYIYADEGIPKGMTSSTRIRELCTSKVHMINKKGVSVIPYHGYVRVVVSGNKEDASFSDDDGSVDAASIDATNARFLPIELHGEEYINRMGGEQFLNSFTKTNEFISHVQWLSENEQGINGYTSDVRMAATSLNARIDFAVRRATQGGSLVKCICAILHNWVLGVSTNGIELKAFNKFILLKNKNGFRFFVSSQLLFNNWDIISRNFSFRERPSAKAVAAVLKSFSMESQVCLWIPEEGIRNTNFWSIDFNLFKDHLEADDINPAEFMKIINEKALKQEGFVKWQENKIFTMASDLEESLSGIAEDVSKDVNEVNNEEMN